MRIAPLVAVGLLASVAVAAPDFTASGPWAVGTTTITFTKASETTGQPRVLATRFWYPTGPAAGSDGVIRRDVPLVPKRWPLIVFSHGSCGIPDQSVFYTAGLASWGFVVAAPPHPGNTTAEIPHCMDPDVFNDSFLNRVADVRFVIDQLLARTPGSFFGRQLNPRRIGVTGHSFGGQTTLRVLAADRRVRVGIALAPTVQSIADLRIRQPTMVMTGALDSLTPFDVDARGAYALLRGPRFLIQIERTGHCAFALACAPTFCGAGCEPGTLSLTEAHENVLRWTIPFFVRYLGHKRVGDALRPSGAADPIRIVEAHPGR